MSDLFISNSDNGGGIAFNVSKIAMELNNCDHIADTLYLNRFDSKLIKKYLFNRKEISIYCTGAHSLLLACFLFIFRKVFFRKTKISQIIYHPRFIDPTISMFRYFLRKVVSLLPKENIYYYSDEAVNASRLASVSDSHVIGLASNFSNIESSRLDSIEYNRFKSNNYDLIISSVARFVDFKHGYLVGVINYAIKNPNIGLLLVGYGPNFDNLKQLAGNCENIYFFGQLTIGQTKTVIESSHIYIGMGTTLVDATSCMIPTLVAIESFDKSISSGFFGAFNGMNFGEYNKNVKYKKIEYYLDEFCRNRDVRVDFNVCQPWVKLIESKKTMRDISIFKAISIIFGMFFCHVIRFFIKKDYQ